MKTHNMLICLTLFSCTDTTEDKGANNPPVVEITAPGASEQILAFESLDVTASISDGNHEVSDLEVQWILDVEFLQLCLLLKLLTT